MDPEKTQAERHGTGVDLSGTAHEAPNRGQPSTTREPIFGLRT